MNENEKTQQAVDTQRVIDDENLKEVSGGAKPTPKFRKPASIPGIDTDNETDA